MKILQTTLVFALVYLMTGCADTVATKQYIQEKGDYRFFDSMYYIGTSGKVGHHMSASARATCKGGWLFGTTTVDYGSVPPGIKRNGTNFTGTPSQPGNWTIRLKMSGLKCNNKVYKDKYINVDFYIKGIAARRVR